MFRTITVTSYEKEIHVKESDFLEINRKSTDLFNYTFLFAIPISNEAIFKSDVHK